MATISSLGVGSGLDLTSLVQGLLEAERVPVEQRLTRREVELQAELSAFGNLSSALSSLQSAISPMKTITTGRTATSSAPDVLGVTVSDTADVASYSVTVDRLASAHSLASAAFANRTDVVGTGTLTFTFGTTSYDPATDTYSGFVANPDKTPASITIDSSNNTLEGIRDAVNAADIGVTASIVNDGSGYRLLFSSDDTGAANSLEVTISGDGDGNDTDNSGLSRLAFNSAATNLQQTVAAQDAQITLNGLTITSPTDTISTAVDGLTFDLKQVSSTPVQVNVTLDRASVRSVIEQFVKGYNEAFDEMAKLTSYNPETGEAGPLLGDSLVRGLQAQLRGQLVSSPSVENTYIRSFVDLGVKTTESGGIEIDSSKLDAALNDHFEEVVRFLNAAGAPLETIMDSYLGSDGLINARKKSIQTGIDRIADERQQLEYRMQQLEQSLVQKYSALDTLLAGLQQTSTYLAQQLARIPVPGQQASGNKK